MPEKISRSFYAHPAAEVARDLLGKVVAREVGGEVVRGRVVETEAYCGETDPGSHAYRGLTQRTAVMFGPPGYLYVYFTYGMHYCMNVVTDSPDTAGAVLIRALEPIDGIDIMVRRRGKKNRVNLCNGPAKLCQALAISRAQNGADLEGCEIWTEWSGPPTEPIAVSSRVGLSAGRDLPMRFFLAGNPFVSPGKPS